MIKDYVHWKRLNESRGFDFLRLSNSEYSIIRADVAKNLMCPPHILAKLADDPSSTVKK